VLKAWQFGREKLIALLAERHRAVVQAWRNGRASDQADAGNEWNCPIAARRNPGLLFLIRALQRM
jgi:hypothetical protein